MWCMHTITGLTPGSPYRVRVRADNDEGEGAWSTWENQSTSEAGNLIPTVHPPDNLKVAENNRAGSAVGDDTVDSESDGG